MFHRTKIKIVASIVGVLVLFLAVTLATVYGSNYLTAAKQNETMLERYTSLYSLESLPGETLPALPPDISGGVLPMPPGDETPQLSDGAVYQLSSFYSAAISDDGTVLAADVGRNGLYQESDIVSLANEILAVGTSSGRLGHLIFRVDQRDGYTLVSFMDITLTESSMKALLLNILAVSLIAICAFLAIAVLLANRIIRPLEENDKKQKQFISDAEHELKTPVSVVSANVELLLREIGDNQWLSNIRYENERMGNLVNDLLELSHAENNPAVFESIDFSRLVEQEVLPFESVSFERGLGLRTDLAGNVVVKGSRRQLGQLVSILVDNAISHSSGGGEVEVRLKKEGRRAVLRVANQGEAIPEEVASRLFDRFYRLDKARGGKEGHFGLGLSIAKAIAEEHRGKIGVESRDGKVVFSVSIPAES